VRVLRVVRVARLIKLVRLVRSSRMFTRWQTSISLSSATRTVMLLFIVEVPLISHWLACLLRLVAQFAPTELDSWLATFGHCWGEEFGAGEGSFDCRDAGELYVDCLNWAAGGIVAGFRMDPPMGPHPNGVPP
jgi:hypothetical protein